MKAVHYQHYGSPDVLTIRELPKPQPKDDEVLVKVRAASINSWDWDMVRGKPYIVRLWGLFAPRYKIPGGDVAGIVEAVGASVTAFKPGDEVLGDLCECGFGTFAEYVCAKENALVHKPSRLSFEDAATLPQAGMLALQGLRYRGELKPGQHILLNGAGGGVGTIALQLALLQGCFVTCVDRKEKHDFLLQLGAHEVIDYAEVDFTTTGKRYDLVLDVIVSRSAKACGRALKKNGVYVIAGGSLSVLFGALLFGRNVRVVTLKPNRGLDELAQMVVSGMVKPVIDRTFSLEETGEAFRYFSTGMVKGKVVITVQ